MRKRKVCHVLSCPTSPRYSCLTPLLSEFSEEDKQLLQAGSIAVRAELPPNSTSQISDKQITDALWHYYYDVEKSVNYLVGTVKKENVKKEPKVQGAFI